MKNNIGFINNNNLLSDTLSIIGCDHVFIPFIEYSLDADMSGKNEWKKREYKFDTWDICCMDLDMHTHVCAVCGD